jgi:DNA-binding response OmpR family regulator
MNTVFNVGYSLHPRSIVPPQTLFGEMKILVAGDTRGVVESLRGHFLSKGCGVEIAYTSEEIRGRLAEGSFDVMICGFLMSDEYALRIVEIIRRESDVRVLFLTKKKDPEYNTKALNLGADDCLMSSAFFAASFFELDARVLRLWQRGVKLAFRDTKIFLNAIEIDLVKQTVKEGGHPVPLTKMEYRILLQLSLNIGRLVPRTAFTHQNGAVLGQSLNTHILHLRKKFTSELSIKTVSCRGFALLPGKKL